MQIKDIVNHSVTTIGNCASEPIHIPGSIQPHGALLAIDAATSTIQFCSANTAGWTGHEPPALLGQSLQQLFPPIYNLVQCMSEEPVACELELHAGTPVSVLIHRVAEQVIIEIEKAPAENVGYRALYNQTVEFIGEIERSGSLQELSQRVAEQTRKITGYDRVMIYCFDKEYNGQVFAEDKADGLEPFLDLHYPHTDIPPQARALYVRNLVRVITDVQYTPVPLLTIDNGHTETLDLSNASLRSVSPIHIQYLKNMKVGATMSISLMLDGRLWGLIACHHYSAKVLNHYQRQAALLQGHFLSSQIRVRQVAEEYQVNLTCEAHLQQLLNKLDQEEDFNLKFEQFTSLQGVCNAGGVVIMRQGELFEKGQVPPQDETRQLINWLAANISSVQYTTAHLKSKYPDAEKISRYAAGILYHTLGKPTENCIIWFRPEVERTVKWAGNPQDAAQKDTPLTPRASFATWKERVRWHSTTWRVSEINAASRFASSLQNHFHLIHLRNEDVRQRMLNEKLRKANEELSNINWIASHDLKEPIRKIHVFASKVLDESLSEQILNSVNKIQQSATRMRTLVDDILSYSIISSHEAKHEQVDLNQVVKEAAPEKLQLTYDHLPIVHGIRFQLKQVFESLLGNAAKFAKADQPARAHISASEVLGEESGEPLLDINKTYHRISVQDNGIGFHPEQSDKIFQIFFRLHDKTLYSGTGIGLAICRKVIENHGGAISAASTPGQGSQFTFFLPK